MTSICFFQILLFRKKPINLIRKQTDTLMVRCPLKKSLMVSQLFYSCIHSNSYSAVVQLELCNLCSTTRHILIACIIYISSLRSKAKTFSYGKQHPCALQHHFQIFFFLFYYQCLDIKN